MSDQLVGFIRNMERRLAHLERLELHNHRIAFLAYNSAYDTDATGAGTTATADFDTEVYDLGGNFAADTFTATVPGKHHFSSTVRVDDLDAKMTRGYIELVTSNRTYRGTYCSPAACQSVGHSFTFQVDADADMDAADTAIIQVMIDGGDADSADIVGDNTSMFTYFSGFLIT